MSGVAAAAVATAAASGATVSAAGRRVCFLTDTEGSWTYNESNDSNETLQLRDDCVLVFGGDAGDKGDDTLRCFEQLVRLKKRHPERVVLLVGNRDVNKMRLTSELADSELPLHAMAREVRDGPLWVPQDKRVTLDTFLARQAAQDASATAASAAFAANTESADADAALLAAANTKVNRLKWMLEHTMGAQGDFERRRKELAARTARRSLTPEVTASAATATGAVAADITTSDAVCTTDAADAIDDESVLQSYKDSVREGGVLREYLELGSLAFIAHDTLFTHGGVIRGDSSGVCALGHVPGRPPMSEWVQELNAWYRQQVQEWIEQPTWSADRSHRGGDQLLQYVLPDHPSSVVMGRHLQASGMPAQLPSAVAQALAASGIRRLVVGHTPHGTCPTVIKQSWPQQTPAWSHDAHAAERDSARTFEEVIMCDTSYSDTAASDNRGVAAVELVVTPDGRAHLHGVLADGRTVAYASDDPLIGRELRDGTQVKAKLRTGGGGGGSGSGPTAT
ncbi:hypothetical protein PybrP1_010290, partial [[Pythium] brassicae (nom. inval.)]